MTMFEKTLGLPLPPPDAPFNPVAADITTTVYFVLAGIVLAYGIKYWRKTGSPIVPIMMVGGFTTSLIEPYLDVLGACWYAIGADYTAYEHMGRHIPWFCIAGYVFYFGALGSLNYLAFRKGATMRQVYWWFAVPVVADIIMEEIMLGLGLYTYYGQQPLVLISNFPLWWAPSNSIGVFICVALMASLGKYLSGWRLLLVPLVMPIIDAIGYAIVALPPIIAVNTEGTPMWLTQIAGISTFILAGITVHLIALLVAVDSPWKKNSNEPKDSTMGPLPSFFQNYLPSTK